MAFFQCKNCKRTWQYPIEKCPECFLPLERIKSRKMKVIGKAKVLIPSIFHPKTPYFVLVLEDEFGNKWIQKSAKEREKIEIEKAKEKEGVVIWKIKYDFLEAIEKTIEILGGLKIDSNSQILILPTLTKPSHPYFRDNTSPEFLKACLIFLLEWGVRPENIKVVSQSFDEIEIGVKAVKSQLFQVCQNFKVKPFDLSQGKFVKKGDLEISEEVFSADLILNLPILKMGKAQSVENLFFFLKKENYLSQKYFFSEKEIWEKLKKELPEILTLAEANHLQDEKGFTYYLNLFLGSFSAQNIDRVFFEITKRKLPEILEDINFEKIQLLGRNLEEI